MADVLPRYKVLFDDLENLNIGDFLTSRKFKVEMLKKGYYDQWDDFFQSAKRSRNYVAIGHSHDYGDSLTALGDLFNQIQYNQIWEEIVAYILSIFIASFKEKKDLSQLRESVELSEFSNNSFFTIDLEILKNSEKPEKIEKTEKQHNVLEVSRKPESKVGRKKSKVFIVHGHNEGLKQSVARFLEKLKLEPIIISEQPTGGNTIIEQIEKHGDVDFAVVLMTGDDEGRKKGERKFKARARQNVILELGYFFGRLGRQHVMVIYENGVEMPSDFLGILHVPYDSGEDWKMKLAKELKNSGFEIDLDQVF